MNKFAENCRISLTTRMGELAAEYRRTDRPVIDLTAGEPDFPAHPDIGAAAVAFLQKHPIRYSCNQGLLELRQLISRKIFKENGIQYGADEILVTHGAKQAVSNAIRALVNPGDEVIIFSPYYPSYLEMIRLSGGVPLIVPSLQMGENCPDFEFLNKKMNSNVSAMILNTPSNPAGVIFNDAVLKKLAEFAEKHDLTVISDEIYSRIIYGNIPFRSFPSLSEDARSRTVLVNGFSKAFAMTGWRIGYAAASNDIIRVMSCIHNQTTGNVSLVSQSAAMAACRLDEKFTQDMLEEWEHRLMTVMRLFDKIGIDYIRPNGAIYIFFKFPLSANEILKKTGLALVPGEAFGMTGYCRMALTSPVTDLIRACARLDQLMKK